MTVDTERLAKAFVGLADTLVDDFDVHDLLHALAAGCTDLLGVAAAGLLLVDEDDRLRLTVASNESAELLELFQLQNDEGPCLDCYRTGQPILVPRLDQAQQRWRRFAPAASAKGFAGVLALPMRLRGQVIGTLNLFAAPDPLPSDEGILPVAQAMADVATIAILQDRLARNREILAEQLQTALTSRVAIEQAKGVLAARLDVEMEEAFALLRNRARAGRRRLAEVAEEAVRTKGADFSRAGKQLGRGVPAGG
jgi:GAF domain-containing protein